MDFEVNRQDFRDTRTVDSTPALLTPGQIRLAVERFALTANNVTYAVAGDMLDGRSDPSKGFVVSMSREALRWLHRNARSTPHPPAKSGGGDGFCRGHIARRDHLRRDTG